MSDPTKSAGAKRAAIARRHQQDIKAFKQSYGRGGPNAGTPYTHIPSGEIGHGEPPPGFSTWHEYLRYKKL